MSEQPELTVVLVVGPRRERGAEALASILAEAEETPLTVMVMDYEEDVTRIAGADHPAVQYRRLEGGAHFGAARAAAARAASTPYIAYVEEHARVLPGWARAVVRAFREGPWAGVGFEVHNGNPGVGRGWITGMMSYGMFMPPLPRGETTFISGHNSAYRRDALLHYGARLDDLMLADMGLFVAMRRDGFRLFLEPDAKMVHRNETTLSATLRAYGSYHRIYGASRAHEGGWSMLRRLAYVAAAPIIPIYYTVRFARFLLRRSPGDVPRFLLNAPYVYLAQLVGAGAQAMGLVLGPGDAPYRFSAFEVSEPRPTGAHGGDSR